jgi:antitoxin (DNA-binding transcriptional repressor) of toxin-antitoxin stability system
VRVCICWLFGVQEGEAATLAAKEGAQAARIVALQRELSDAAAELEAAQRAAATATEAAAAAKAEVCSACMLCRPWPRLQDHGQKPGRCVLAFSASKSTGL